MVGCASDNANSNAGFSTTSAGLLQFKASVSGILVQSRSGALSVVDELTPGFTALANVRIEVLNGMSGFTDRNGEFSLPSGAGRQRLLVNNTILEVPAFEAGAGPVTGLAMFPSRLQLPLGSSLALRVVGQDEQGRFVKIPPSQVTFSQNAGVLNPQVPDTSILNRAESDASQAGEFEIQAQYGSLTSSLDCYVVNAACAASLAGRTLPGALVEVDGFPQAVVAASDGSFELTGLAPVPAQLRCYLNGQQVGLNVGPQLSLYRTDCNPSPLSAVYSQGITLAVPSASGLALRPSGEILVTDGAGLHLFSGGGTPLTAPAATLQQARGVATDFSGEAYVASSGGDEIAVIPNSGAQLNIKTSAPAPSQLCLDAGANIFVTFAGQNKVQYLVNQGPTWNQGFDFGGTQLLQPRGVAAHRDGRVFVADHGHNRIVVYELSQLGRLLRGGPANGPIVSHIVRQWPVEDPRQLALGPDGAVFVSTAGGFWRFDDCGLNGRFFPTAGDPSALAAGPDGSLWVGLSDGVHQFVPTQAHARVNPLPVPSGRSLIGGNAFNSFETNVLNLMHQYEIAGGSISVSVNGRLVLQRGYGWAAHGQGLQQAAEPQHLFRFASCSKTFTSLALLLQMQNKPGSIAPASRPFEAGGLLAARFTQLKDGRMRDIDALQLLRMTAGLDAVNPIYYPLARTLGGSNPPASAVQILDYIYRTFDLANAPGDTFVYSDVAYMTLGRLIEAVDGARTYGQIVTQDVLPLLGISDMRIGSTRAGETAPNEVQYYPFSGEACGPSVFNNSPDPVPYPYGAGLDGVAHDSTGGWIGTSTDLVRIANRLCPTPQPGFSNPLDATRRGLLYGVPNFPGVNPDKYFGAGWGFTASGGAILTMNKDGSLPGTTAFVQYQRQGSDHVVWAMVFNGRPGPGTKRAGNSLAQLSGQVQTLITSQAGQWPSGDLF